MSKRLHVEVGSLSDPGQVRELNEDYFGTPETMEISLDLVEQKGRLYAVADGMGGHAAGEVASWQAISTLFEEYYASPSAEIIKRMKMAIEAANAELHAQASLDQARAGMGTTLVAAVLQGDDLYVANVGDSRAYLVREQSVEQVTRDHSWLMNRSRLASSLRKRHVNISTATSSPVPWAPDPMWILTSFRERCNRAMFLCSVVMACPMRWRMMRLPALSRPIVRKRRRKSSLI